jgi:predicted ATPase
MAAVFWLTLRNFRSIKKQTLGIRPITILTGANGGGKSSFLYGVAVGRNVVTNPASTLDQLFNLGELDLGGFKETINRKNVSNTLEIHVRVDSPVAGIETEYLIKLGRLKSTLELKITQPIALDLSVDVTFPYTLNQGTPVSFEYQQLKGTAVWNGLGSTLTYNSPSSDEGMRKLASKASTFFNAPLTFLRTADLVGLKRGFSKSVYAPIPLQQQVRTEDEVATSLALDREAEARVSFALEKLVNKSFAARPSPLGGGTFYVQTVDRTTEFICDLVNEGFGINQLVYLLAKITQPGPRIICIEEPEIHLHPELLGRFADTLLLLARRNKSYFLISSHSEQFVVSFLNRVARKEATSEEVGIYYVEKDSSGNTTASEQALNEKGQLEGGLRSFYEPTIETLRDFLTLTQMK